MPINCKTAKRYIARQTPLGDDELTALTVHVGRCASCKALHDKHLRQEAEAIDAEMPSDSQMPRGHGPDTYERTQEE